MSRTGWRAWVTAEPGRLVSPTYAAARDRPPWESPSWTRQRPSFNWTTGIARAACPNCDHGYRCPRRFCGLYYYPEVLPAVGLAVLWGHLVVTKVTAIGEVAPDLAGEADWPSFKAPSLRIQRVYARPSLIKAWPIPQIRPRPFAKLPLRPEEWTRLADLQVKAALKAALE